MRLVPLLQVSCAFELTTAAVRYSASMRTAAADVGCVQNCRTCRLPRLRHFWLHWSVSACQMGDRQVPPTGGSRDAAMTRRACQATQHDNWAHRKRSHCAGRIATMGCDAAPVAVNAAAQRDFFMHSEVHLFRFDPSHLFRFDRSGSLSTVLVGRFEK